MFLKKLFASLFGKKNNSQLTPLQGYCPNCWGREEYGGKFYEAVKNRNVDVNSIDPSAGWVKEYADKHLSGIKLNIVDGSGVCPKCKLTFHESTKESK